MAMDCIIFWLLLIVDAVGTGLAVGWKSEPEAVICQWRIRTSEGEFEPPSEAADTRGWLLGKDRASFANCYKHIAV